MIEQLRDAQFGQTLWVDGQGRVTMDAAEIINRMSNTVREISAAVDAPVYANGAGPILTSPDGTQYRLTVANGGGLSTTAV